MRGTPRRRADPITIPTAAEAVTQVATSGLTELAAATATFLPPHDPGTRGSGPVRSPSLADVLSGDTPEAPAATTEPDVVDPEESGDLDAPSVGMTSLTPELYEQVLTRLRRDLLIDRERSSGLTR